MPHTDALLLVLSIMAGVVLLYFVLRDSELLHLTCLPSRVDGRTYCVRERDDQVGAADLLAHTTNAMTTLVGRCHRKYPSDRRVQRLVTKYNPTAVRETTPGSEHTAYSENKGEKIAFCVNKKNNDNSKFVDRNTLAFVATHELAHVMTKSTGHTPEFWDNFKFLLEEAEEAGVYKSVDYGATPVEYCGMTLNDNPLHSH